MYLVVRPGGCNWDRDVPRDKGPIASSQLHFSGPQSRGMVIWEVVFFFHLRSFILRESNSEFFQSGVKIGPYCLERHTHHYPCHFQPSRRFVADSASCHQMCMVAKAILVPSTSHPMPFICIIIKHLFYKTTRASPAEIPQSQTTAKPESLASLVLCSPQSMVLETREDNFSFLKQLLA